MDLRTNKVYGFEALARLKVDNLGLVSPPLEFIPVAEKKPSLSYLWAKGLSSKRLTFKRR